jgi:hypothetical protein
MRKPPPHLCILKDPHPPPLWLGVTSVGESYLDGPVGNPPSARWHFDRRSLIVDPITRGAASRGREEAARGGDGGGRVTPRSISPTPEDVDPAMT